MRPLATSSPPSALPASLRAGALAAAATWAVVVLPALVGWVAAPESSVGWFSAVSVGSAIFFTGHGQSIGDGALSISVTPVLLLVIFVYITFRWARRLAAVERIRVGPSAWSSVAQRQIVPGFLGGDLAVTGVVALMTLGGPVGPGFVAVFGCLLVPLAALGFVLLRPHDEASPALVRVWFRRGPTWLPSVWRIGWKGSAVLLAIGLVIAVARVAFSWDAVARVHGEYGVNVAAAVVVVLAQLLLLGNAATWALSFTAGSGFQVAVGATISPAAAHPGLMPLVPLLAALPDDADYPALAFVVVLVPVAVGVVIGRWVDSELEFFGNTRARVTATVAAAAIAVTVVVALTALGNGGVGVDRLSAVGAPLLAFAAALLIEVTAGALIWLGWRLLRERPIVEAPATADTDAKDGVAASVGEAASSSSD